MRTLTEKQAEFLREIRKGLAEAIKTISEKYLAVRLECGHDTEDKNCPLCGIAAGGHYEFYSEGVENFAASIDFHLQRGPAV